MQHKEEAEYLFKWMYFTALTLVARFPSKTHLDLPAANIQRYTLVWKENNIKRERVNESPPHSQSEIS